jgi:hypothetical protein
MSNFETLTPEAQAPFINASAKSDMSPEELFDHLVPTELQDSSSEVLTFMDGGTVIQDQHVHFAPGIGNGETVYTEFSLPDRDISRVISGENGGQYTADNIIMEEASINRARGAADMTDIEYADAVEANEIATSVINDSSEVITTTVEATEAASAGFVEVVGSVAEAVLPVIVGIKCATTAAKSQEKVIDKLGYGSLAGGAGVAATVAVFTNPILGPIAGAISVLRLAQVIHNRCSKR